MEEEGKKKTQNNKILNGCFSQKNNIFQLVVMKKSVSCGG